MKRGLFVLLAFAYGMACIYAADIGFSLSYSPNMEFPQRLVEAVLYKEGPWSFDIVEHGGRKADVSVLYNLDGTGLLSHSILANTSYSYGLCGWSGLGYMLGMQYSKGPFGLCMSIGVQLAAAYGPYFGDVLFSITPLAETVLKLKTKNFEANAYMSFVSPHCREWKAVPTIGGSFAAKAFGSYWVGGEAFVKYAEFLTDTRTMVSAFGIRLSCQYRTEVQR